MKRRRNPNSPYVQANKAARRRGRYSGRSTPLRTRQGYSSVARTRGAPVTGEMKYFDCDLNLNAIPAVTTTWVAGTLQNPATTINLGDAAVATPNCLFAPKVSAALNGRIGRKVTVYKIKIRGTITCAAQAAQTTADPGCLVRWMLVQDMQSNAAAMTSAQLMNDASAASSTIVSMQNPNNFGRFRVLKDRMINIADLNLTGDPAANQVLQASFMRNFKCTYKWRGGMVVHFNATNGGTIADLVDNGLHFIAGCSNVSFTPTLSYYSRVSYKEI